MLIGFSRVASASGKKKPPVIFLALRAGHAIGVRYELPPNVISSKMCDQLISTLQTALVGSLKITRYETGTGGLSALMGNSARQPDVLVDVWRSSTRNHDIFTGEPPTKQEEEGRVSDEGFIMLK
jgi:hypothetical protein